MGRIDIGDKVHLQISTSKRFESFRDHNGAKVGTADPNVDDVGNGLSCVSFPVPRPDLPRKSLHVLAGGFDFWHEVVTIDDQREIGRTAKCDVKN